MERNSAIEYANLARLGAKVKGIPYMTFDEGLAWIDNHDSECFDQRMKVLFEEELSPLSVAENLKPTRDYVERLLEASLDAALEIERLPEKFSNPNYANHAQIRKNLQNADLVNSLVDSSKPDYRILFEGQTKVELVSYKKKIKVIEGPNEQWVMLQRNKEYYWSLVEGCSWLLGHLLKCDSS